MMIFILAGGEGDLDASSSYPSPGSFRRLDVGTHGASGFSSSPQKRFWLCL